SAPSQCRAGLIHLEGLRFNLQLFSLCYCAAGQQLAVFRGEDGKAYVLDAYCPHLGANLAVGGQVSGNCLECPFHGWQFNGGDGKCVKIPYSQKVPESLNNQILVWFHCDGEEPTWSVPEQEEISNGSWVYRGRTEHFISAHIQEVAENAGDVAHLSHLHGPGAVGAWDLRYINSKVCEFLRHDWKVEWEANKPEKHCSEMNLKHSMTLFGSHCSLMDMDVVARQVGPSLVFLDFKHPFLGRGMMLQSVTPVEPLLQCSTHTLYYQANIPAVVPKFILRGECMQVQYIFFPCILRAQCCPTLELQIQRPLCVFLLCLLLKQVAFSVAEPGFSWFTGCRVLDLVDPHRVSSK
uniref:cholesterol 7-desaturase n=1 Tax=Oryzias sinensis TaxID=183150 RepID=A0A8C7WZ86_9TELE